MVDVPVKPSAGVTKSRMGKLSSGSQFVAVVTSVVVPLNVVAVWPCMTAGTARRNKSRLEIFMMWCDFRLARLQNRMVTATRVGNIESLTPSSHYFHAQPEGDVGYFRNLP